MESELTSEKEPCCWLALHTPAADDCRGLQQQEEIQAGEEKPRFWHLLHLSSSPFLQPAKKGVELISRKLLGVWRKGGVAN